MQENRGRNGVVCEGIGAELVGPLPGKQPPCCPCQHAWIKGYVPTTMASSRREESLEAPVTNAPHGLGCCPTNQKGTKATSAAHFGVHQLDPHSVE